jgi:hypothetical protein
MSTPNFQDDDRFDGLYLNVAQTTRGIEPLLDSVFSFLRRKTDFLAGPPGAPDGAAAAVNKVNEVLQKHVALYQKEQKRKQQPQQPSSSKNYQTKKVSTMSDSKKASTVTQPFKTVNHGHDEDDDIIEMNTDGGFDVSSQTSPSNKPIITPLSSTSEATSSSLPPSTFVEKGSINELGSLKTEQAPTTTTTSKSVETKGNDDDIDDDTAPVPVGNGGTVEGKYVWTQTLADLVVTIPVPDNTRGRDLNVVIARTHLKVVLKSSSAATVATSLSSKKDDVLVDGDLSKSIICDDSFWTVEDGNRLVINLQKQNQMEWWDAVCKGDPIINVRKINPENSSLSDLDGETRKTVEKMMVCTGKGDSSRISGYGNNKGILSFFLFR